MGFWTSAYEGYRQRDDELLGQRQKAAAAFQEFIRNNPTATGAEFDAFINATFGDSRYLRKAVPDEMLNAVKADANTRRQRQAQQLAFEDMQRKQQESQLIDTVVQDAYRSGERDPMRVLDRIYKQYGIEDPARRDALRSTIESRDLPSLFSRMEQDDVTKFQRELAADINAGLLLDPSGIDSRIPDYLKGSERMKGARSALERLQSSKLSSIENNIVQDMVGMIQQTNGQIDDKLLIERVRDATGDDRLASQILPRVRQRVLAEAGRVSQERHQNKLLQLRQMAESNPMLIQSVGSDPKRAQTWIEQRARELQIDPNTAKAVSASLVDELGQWAAIGYDQRRAKVVADSFGAVQSRADQLMQETTKDVSAILTDKKSPATAAAHSVISQGYVLTGPQLEQIRANPDAYATSEAILATFKPSSALEVAQQGIDRMLNEVAPKAEPMADYLRGTKDSALSMLTQIAQKPWTPDQKLVELQRQREEFVQEIAARNQNRQWVKAGSGGFDEATFMQSAQEILGSIDKAIAQQQQAARMTPRRPPNAPPPERTPTKLYRRLPDGRTVPATDSTW